MWLFSITPICVEVRTGNIYDDVRTYLKWVPSRRRDPDIRLLKGRQKVIRFGQCPI